MPALSKPIPALYTVYILRSTVRHASLYIGSTPNPPRRLKQHNGQARGGAARTARHSLRPWEMVALVSGFPGMVAALKFEWALTNPHLSLHIPSESRISVSTQRKRNGHPRRPGTSLTSVVSNLHVLLRVPSFARWPLTLHFFRPEVLAAWEKWCASSAGEPLRDTLDIATDFGPGETADGQPAGASEALAEAGTSETTGGATEPAPWGIHALPLDYAPMKEYVAKGRSIASFEREGDCVVCGEAMPSGDGLYPVCSTEGCEGVGHLDCWSRRVLGANHEGAVLPVAGTCPKCGGQVRWGDMMRELTLRVRGQKEVEKLLKKKRAAKSAKTT